MSIGLNRDGNSSGVDANTNPQSFPGWPEQIITFELLGSTGMLLFEHELLNFAPCKTHSRIKVRTKHTAEELRLRLGTTGENGLVLNY